MPDPVVTRLLPRGASFDLIFVEGGSFMMGSAEEEAFGWESPVHQVNVPSFYIGKYPVTQAEWRAVMGADHNPAHFWGDNRPVECVSWDDTQMFLAQLNHKTGRAYRLLTEAEWEYAARGGRRSNGYRYSGSNKLKDVGWYNRNSNGATKPVGRKYPNELGVYDLSGNVYEWVEDHWHDDYQGAPDDGSAWVDKAAGASRVIRGGCWDDGARGCSVSYRDIDDPTDRLNYVGFRLGLSLQSVG